MPSSNTRLSHPIVYHPYAQQQSLLSKQSMAAATAPLVPITPLRAISIPPLPPMPESLSSAAPLLRRSAKNEEITKTIPTATGDLLLSTFQVKLPPQTSAVKKSEPKEPKPHAKSAPKVNQQFRPDENVSKRVLQNRKAQKRFRIRRQEHLKDLEHRAELLDEAYTHIDQLKAANAQLVQRLQQMEQFIHTNCPGAFGPSPTTLPSTSAITSTQVIPTIIQPYEQLISSPEQQPPLEARWQGNDSLSDSDFTDMDPLSVPNSPMNPSENLPVSSILKSSFNGFNPSDMDSIDSQAFWGFPMDKDNSNFLQGATTAMPLVYP